MNAAPTTLLRRPLPAVAGLAGGAVRAGARGARRVPPRAWLVSVAVIVALGLGWMWVRDSPLVAVRKVQIIGAHGPDAMAIRAALERAALDQTTLDVDQAALQRAVGAYPLVKGLEVRAHPLHRLTIVVESERPVAWIAGGGQRVAVNATGKLLRGAFTALSLPTVAVSVAPAGGHVTDARTLRALDALAEAPARLAARVSRVRTVPGIGLVASLRNGPQLRLGDTARLRAKWLAAAAVLADPSSRGATYIDLRVPERPAAGGAAPASQTGAAPAPASTYASTPSATATSTPVATATSTPVATPASTAPAATLNPQPSLQTQPTLVP